MTVHSSVRTFNTLPAEIDAGAASLALIGVGDLARLVVQTWRSQLPDDLPVWHLCTDDLEVACTGLAAQLQTARVGWRLMAAGSEAAVTRLSAQAVAAGADDGEIRLTVTGADIRRVYCAHCGALSIVTESDRVSCTCGRDLVVRQHYSARLAGYLGVADG